MSRYEKRCPAPIGAPDWYRRALELEHIEQAASRRQPHIEQSIIAVTAINALVWSAIGFVVGYLLTAA
jgi:predicted cobalt transporter CbtA